MKKSILIAFILINTITSSTYADKPNWVLGVGYNLATITQKSTKLVIDRYNETRPWLDKKMGYLRPSAGIAYSLGWDGGAYTFEIGVSRYNATSRASGIAPGTNMEVTRELKLKSTGITITGLWDFADFYDNTTEYGLGINMGLSMGGGEYQTRIDNAPFEKITNTGFSNFDMFLGIFYEKPFFGGDTEEGFAVRIMPFTHGIFGLGGRDMQPLLKELDPVNASANPLPLGNTLSFHRHWGLQVKLLYRIDR
jgi:hypothetical protein